MRRECANMCVKLVGVSQHIRSFVASFISSIVRCSRSISFVLAHECSFQIEILSNVYYVYISDIPLGVPLDFLALAAALTNFCFPNSIGTIPNS